ncbi:MAG TPA: M28 family peptidase [Longimicrobiales bacterium]|nr:M28 family peptidase [Longimicrobiales bacterium]
MRSLLVAATLLATAMPGLAQTSAPAAPVIDTLSLRAHTRFLSDDALEGRGTGTRGERVAAAYIASELERLGLDGAAPDGGYRLPVPLRAARVQPSTHLMLRDATGDSTAFRHDQHFVLNTGGAAAFRDFAGDVLFAGSPAEAADALSGADLRGRVIAVRGPLGAEALGLVPSWIEAGVTGVVLLVPDAGQYDLYVRSRGDTRYFVAASVQDPVWQPALPVIIAGPELTNALLAGAPEMTERAVAVGRSIRADIEVMERALPVANLAGVLPGSDPARRNEYVVYTAHYDHLGISVPDASGDSIYNGFSDNSAGVAMLLSIAEALRDDPPARSVLFVFLTGEERGLLGASYFAADPPVPLENMRALINLDAGAPPAPPVSWRIALGENNPLAPVIEEVARERGWTVQLGAASPNSDYWPFLQRGVPAAFIIPGDVWENTSPEQRDALRRRWDRYHQAGDHYHPDFPFSGLQRYAEFALAVGLRVASS